MKAQMKLVLESLQKILSSKMSYLQMIWSLTLLEWTKKPLMNIMLLLISRHLTAWDLKCLGR